MGKHCGQVDGDGRPRKRWREVFERRYERRDFVGRMLGAGQGYGKAKGEVNPSTLGKTTSLK